LELAKRKGPSPQEKISVIKKFTITGLPIYKEWIFPKARENMAFWKVLHIS
jgi:hypothetical protein